MHTFIEQAKQTKQAKCTTKRTAFTLIEVLLVIGILVVLAGVAVVVYTNVKPNADKKATLLLVESTNRAVEMFFADMNRYPTAEEGFSVLIEKPEDEAEAEKWNGVYLKDGKIPVDPWGQELKYERIESEGETTVTPFRVYSLGPDKEDGTEDDIPQKEEKE